VYENIVFLSQSGWRYSDIITFPIKKRNWLFEMFIDLTVADEDEGE